MADDPSVSTPVSSLVAAIASVRAVVPASLPGSLAVVEAEALLQQLELLRQLVLTRIADVDVRQLHSLADAPSTGTWLAAQQTSVTRTEVALARRLTAFPAIAAAVDSGELCVAVAAKVAAALVKVRPHVDRPDGLIDEQPAEQTVRAVVVDGVLSLICEARGGMVDTDPLLASLRTALSAVADSSAPELSRLTDAFVLLGRHLEPYAVPAALAQLVDALLPNELERRAREAEDDRGFCMRLKDDGSGWLVTRGDLDLECGELLNTVVSSELAVDEDNPTDTEAYERARQAGWRPGDEPPTGCASPRSLDQRRHDALRNGLRRYLDSGVAGLRDKVTPHLSVTVGIDLLSDRPGALPPVAASGARLPRSLVRTWWCDSRVTRFVLSLGRRVLEVSHTERTLRAHERQAKRVETGGRCQAAGCRGGGPGNQLVPHHADPWASSGTTSLADTVMVCRLTHHDLHSGGRTILLKDGRRLGPHGWVTEAAS